VNINPIVGTISLNATEMKKVKDARLIISGLAPYVPCFKAADDALKLCPQLTGEIDLNETNPDAAIRDDLDAEVEIETEEGWINPKGPEGFAVWTQGENATRDNPQLTKAEIKKYLS